MMAISTQPLRSSYHRLPAQLIWPGDRGTSRILRAIDRAIADDGPERGYSPSGMRSSKLPTQSFQMLRSTENPIVVLRDHGGSIDLCRAQLARELHVDRTANESLIANHRLDVVRFKELHRSANSPSRQRNVGGDIFATCNNSRLVECGKPHCLGLIEFRILKCRQAKQSVQHRRRQTVLLDVDKV